jgi:DNA-directed RNA polymerase subunit N (RpoN/RPB10)
MKVNCTSCGYEVNLDHTVFKDYVGPVKCFCCGAMIEVKIASGFVYSINPLAILNGRASDNLVENPQFISE